jgi:hypothetical protein
MKTSNRAAGALVSRQVVFKGSNTYSERNGVQYVVYSYGEHFPLYLWVNDTMGGTTPEGVWYENRERYSSSTTRHRSQLRPTWRSGKYCETSLRTTAQLKQMVFDHNKSQWSKDNEDKGVR